MATNKSRVINAEATPLSSPAINNPSLGHLTPETQAETSLNPPELPSFLLPSLQVSSSRQSLISQPSSLDSCVLTPPPSDSGAESPPYKPAVDDLTSLDLDGTRCYCKRVRRRMSQLSNHAGSLCSHSSGSVGSGAEDNSTSSMVLSRSSWNPSSRKIEDALRRNGAKTQINMHTTKAQSKIGVTEQFRTRYIRAPGCTMADGVTVGDSAAPMESLITAFAHSTSGNLGASELGASELRAGGDEYTGFDKVRDQDRDTSPTRTSGSKRKSIRSQSRENDTPATITLKKASLEHYCQLSTPTREQSVHGQEKKASFSQPDTSSHENHQLNSSSIAPIHAYGVTTQRDWVNGAHTLSFASLSLPVESATRRKSCIAIPTLTIVNVQAAPEERFGLVGSFCDSLIVDAGSRRSSIVKDRWRGSIHEVSWKHDYTSSSGNTDGQGVSKPSSDAVQSGGSKGISIGDSSRKKPVENEVFDGQQTLLSADATIETSTGNMQSMDPKLMQWSWGNPNLPDPAPKTAEGEVTATAELLSRQPPSRTRKKSGSTKRTTSRVASVSSTRLEVESFPPLMERKSTSEWCRAPIVDMDDPKAGRTSPAEDGALRGKLPVSAYTDDALAGKSDGKRLNSCLDMKMGSAVGFSSHTRRRSTAQRRSQVVAMKYFSDGLRSGHAMSRSVSQKPLAMSERSLAFAMACTRVPPPCRKSVVIYNPFLGGDKTDELSPLATNMPE